MLEAVISANPKNVEYRFLRLIVQENAPKVLKYNTKIKEDAKIIKAGYQKVTSSVKQAIVSYAKKSVNLNL